MNTMIKSFVIGLLSAVFFCSSVHAESEVRFFAAYGTDFVRTGSVTHWSEDFGENALSLGLRYFPETRTFYQLKYLGYRNPKSSDYDGNYLSLSIGREWFGDRGPGTFFITSAVGVGYLDNPDGHLPKGKLTKNRQFELLGGIGYHWSKDVSIHLDWDHISNGKYVFNKGSDYSPNVGRDFVMLGISKAF